MTYFFIAFRNFGQRRPYRILQGLIFSTVLPLAILTHGAVSQEVVDVPSNELGIMPDKIAKFPPLAKAILARDTDSITKLVMDRRNVNDPVVARSDGRAGYTPLILATALSDGDTVQKLLRHGAKITLLDDYRRSALWYAAINENPTLLRVLAKASDARSIVNEADTELKQTPVHIVASTGTREDVSVLVQIGGSLDQKDIFGRTPRQYCQRQKLEGCSELSPR
jgi:hypothetical protein